MLKKIVNVLLVLLFILCLLPVFSTIGLGVGTVVPALWVVLIFVLVNYGKRLRERSKRIYGAAVAVLCTGLAVFAVMSALMLSGFKNDAPASGDATVIVLGAQINGSSPSVMLRNRLEVAEGYLNMNGDAKCIVTGGRGDDEDTAESAVMKNWLVEQGIDSDRIYEDDLSANTDENIAFAADIIEEEGLSDTVVIATDEFHQYRARLLARRYGLDAHGVKSGTPWYFFINYWVREMFAIVKDGVLRV